MSSTKKAVREVFEGRVRKWTKRWVPITKGTKSGEVRLTLLKYVQTEEVTEERRAPRHPRLRPVTDPRNTPLPPMEKKARLTAVTERPLPDKRMTRSQVNFDDADVDMEDKEGEEMSPEPA